MSGISSILASFWGSIIITVLTVVVILGLIAGAIVMIVLAIKKHSDQNKITEKYCIRCGMKTEKGKGEKN